MGAYAMAQHPSSVRLSSVQRHLFHLNDFSRTTRPISTKIGREHAWGMGIQICSNKGAGLFWGTIRGKIGKILINLQKSSSHEPLNLLIFSMKHPWGKDIEVCSNKLPMVRHGPTPGA